MSRGLAYGSDPGTFGLVLAVVLSGRLTNFSYPQKRWITLLTHCVQNCKSLICETFCSN